MFMNLHKCLFTIYYHIIYLHLMLKKIFLFLLFTSVLQLGFSQPCGITKEAQEIITERLLENKATLRKGFVQSREITYVPVMFHLVANSSKNGRVNFISVLAQINRLNEDYKDQNIQFFMSGLSNNHYVKEINNTKLYEDPSSTGGYNTMQIKKKKSYVNIFVVKTANTGGLGTTLGYYSPQGDWIVLRKDETKSSSTTLSHEVGHFFSLHHPFYGWDGEVYDKAVHGNPVQATSPGGIPVENQDRTGACKNCDTAGDFVCDTPPDYNFGFGWGDCRPYDRGTKDPCGVEVDPMENNYMGYFNNCDGYVFTPDQKALIAADISNRITSGKLNGTLKPETTDLIATEIPTDLIYPINGDTLRYHANIELSWASISGATGYVFEIATRSSFGTNYERFYLTDAETSIHFDELKKDQEYFWRVTAYNQSSSNVGSNEKSRFVTGEGTVSADDIESVNFVSITPNPSNQGSSVILKLNTIKSFDSAVQVFDIAGKLLLNNNVHFANGYNSMEIETQTLGTGLYFVRIQTEKGTINEKIVIQ